MTDSESPDTGGQDAQDLSRRGFLGGAGGLAASGLVVGAVAGAAGAFGIANLSPTVAAVAADEHPFYNQRHQAGIKTEPQKYTVFMTYSITAVTASQVQILLARWSAAIAQMTKGDPIGNPEPSRPDAVAQDTGEALDLGPEGLTVTMGFGPGLFDDRFGLAGKKPALLEQIPALPSDQLQDAYVGGDLSLQACANDPQVAYHAIRNLTRMARGTAATLWTVSGFGRASAGPHQRTPRNLMGFKDGTRNIFEDADLAKWVWTSGDDQAWMAGGTYQVARKIHMNIETWDTDPIGDQQDVFGRTKLEGAPLSGKREHDEPDFAKKDASGDPVIPATSHIALAAHENNGGVKILRRSYNYTEGIDDVGQIDAGLLFIAYMNDPKHFIDLQTKLGSVDRLNEYIRHIGSAIFAVPPAPRQGTYLGAQLFA